MKWYVIKSPQWKGGDGFPVMKKGWGNGYVAVPPTHPLYLGDVTQKKISLVQSLDINGGITYSDFGNGQYAPKGWWVFGFDTAHFGDTIEKWPKEAVEAETKRLYCQLLDIELGEL